MNIIQILIKNSLQQRLSKKLLQQKYQTMYFDNYVKPNPSSVHQKFDSSSISLFHPQSINGLEPIQFNQRNYYNQRPGENTSVPSPTLNKNAQQPPKQYVTYQTGHTPPHMQRQQSFQPKNTISFNSDILNSAHNRQNSEYMRRRDSISQNTFLRSQQGHSPSTNKSTAGENGGKNSLKITMNNQQQRNLPQGQKNNGSSSNLSNFMNSGFNDQEYGRNLLLNKDQKDKIQEKNQQKPGYFNSSNYNQYGFSENRVGSKPYALGFKSGLQNIDLDLRKALESNAKQKPLQEKQIMYNYQLKNMPSQLASFTKPINTGSDQYKYYTPSLAKKSSLKDDSITINKNGFSQVVDVRHNNNMLEREGNHLKENDSVLSDRQMHKSPSFDSILVGTGTKQNFKNKQQSTIENNSQYQYTTSNPISQNSSKNYSQQNITPRNNSSNSVIDNQPYTAGSKPSSQSFIVESNMDKIPKQSTKNYHALIQNLQKKFSQQKKSSQTFESKQKIYIVEINKRDEKIKRQETIIDNNKETISALDQTIKQLRKKLDYANSEANNRADSTHLSNLSMIEELKRENGGLRDELKKQRKKSVTIAQQNFQKQIFQRQQAKLKDLQKAFIEANNNRQALSLQLTKLKETSQSIQENYCHEIEEHQKIKEEMKQLQKVKQELKDYIKTKQQLQKAKNQIEQLNCNFKEKVQSFNQLKGMLQNLEQKYQGSLKKIVSLQEELDQQSIKTIQRIQSEKKDKQLLVQETEKLRTKLQRVQGEIDFKSMKIKNLEQKLSEKEAQIQRTISAHHKAICNNQVSANQTITMCLQQSKIAKQRLALKQQAYQTIAHELHNKNKQIQSLSNQKTQNLYKITSLELQIQQLQAILSQQQTKNQENFKTTSDSGQARTFSSQFSKESMQFKEIQSLLEAYHERYSQIVSIFNLNHSNQQKSHNQESDGSNIAQNECFDHNFFKLPSRQYLIQFHPIVTDQARKILKDMKKLLNVLKECQADSQLKTQRLHELDKNFKKQANKINQLLGQIHLKNMTIIEINHMQLENDIFRLNEKYQILKNVGL